MDSATRFSYLLGWVFLALAVIDKALGAVGVEAVDKLPVSARGLLMFAGILFLATIASAAYAQGAGTKGQSTAA